MESVRPCFEKETLNSPSITMFRLSSFPPEPDNFAGKKEIVMKRMKHLLPLALVVSAVSGIGLHIAGHETCHDIWHNWAIAHVLSSLFGLISVVFHVKRHWHWYKSVASNGIGKKSRITLALSAVFLIVTVTGIILIACVDGANSAIGLWHYKIGLLLLVLSFIHCIKRKRK